VFSTGCKSVNTSKTSTAFLNVEGNFFLAVTTDKESDCEVLLSLLKESYASFAFFSGGSFDGCLGHYCDGLKDELKTFCRLFFSKFISGVKLTSCLENVFHPLTFLPVSAHRLIRAANFVNRVGQEFPFLGPSVLLQEGCLVWTGLEKADTRCLYRYVTSTLLPALTHKSDQSMTSGSPFRGRKGQFLVGKDRSPPDLWLKGGESKHTLVVYHALAATLCLCVPEISSDLPDDFFVKFESSVGAKLAALSADLADVFNVSRNDSLKAVSCLSPGSDAPPLAAKRFFYYNDSNSAAKSTLDQHDHLVALDLTSEVKEEEVVEMAAKSVNDDWTIVKKAGSRTIVAVLSHCNTLAEAGDDLDKLTEAEFKNVYVADNEQKGN